MLSFWGKPLTTLFLLAFAALIAWAIFGPILALVTFSAGLLGWLARHLLNLYRFRRWLRNPSVDSVPQGSGLWASAYAGLYRLVRSQSQSESKLSAALTRFRQAGAAMPDGMVILDESDRIEW